MIKSLFIAAAITASAAAPALASQDSAAATAEIRIDDLDLSTQSDQQRLDQRVNRAARRMCATGARGLAAVTAENHCIALALQSAAPQTERAIALARSNRRLAQIDMTVSG